MTPGGSTPAGLATLPPDDGLLAAAPPEITAPAWILYDGAFGQVLAEREADMRRAVASTTKIMTALVVLERTDPEETVRITAQADRAGESEIGLVPDESGWTVGDLLAALILHSANDAAVALAEHVGGSVAGFADLMNARAEQLGLWNTHFVNPHGLDHPDHYSSARDLLVLAVAAMEDPRFERLVQVRSANLPDTPGGEPRVTVNRNRLLAEYPGAIGIKTGFTSRAALTLVAVAERDRRRIYAVVLGSTDHFGDAMALLDYGFAEFGAMTLVPATSETRRPLMRRIDHAIDEDFELFHVPGGQVAPVDAVPAEEGEAPEQIDGEAPGEGPEGAAPAEGSVPAPPGPVAAVETDRRPEQPGLLEAATWIVRYWNWIVAGRGER